MTFTFRTQHRIGPGYGPCSRQDPSHCDNGNRALLPSLRVQTRRGGGRSHGQGAGKPWFGCCDAGERICARAQV